MNIHYFNVKVLPDCISTYPQMFICVRLSPKHRNWIICLKIILQSPHTLRSKTNEFYFLVVFSINAISRMF